jgi:hypothetical protein
MMFCGVANVSSVCVFVQNEKMFLIFTSEVGLSIDIYEWMPVLRTVMFYNPRKQGSFFRILLSVFAYRTCDGPITHPGISNRSTTYIRIHKSYKNEKRETLGLCDM